MGYYLGQRGYYEGDRYEDGDAEVTRRPSAAHEWSGDDWILSVTAQRAALLPDLRALRDKAMNVLDGIQGDALATGDTATALAIKDAKQACRDIPALDVSSATSEAQMRALYLAEWRRITAMVPAGVRVAFAAVLA